MNGFGYSPPLGSAGGEDGGGAGGGGRGVAESGKWYSVPTGTYASATNFTMQNDEAYLCPAFFDQPTTIQKVGLRVTSGTVTGRFAVYGANEAGGVGDLIEDFGVAGPVSSPGDLEIAVDIELSGRVFFAAIPAAAAVVAGASSSFFSQEYQQGSASLDDARTPHLGLIDMAYGAFPTTPTVVPGVVAAGNKWISFCYQIA